jgi:isoleucyl-tRNA synthetase
LIQEGLARELINKVQNLRKDSGLEVTDKITVAMTTTTLVKQAVETNRDYIMSEILATVIEYKESLDEGHSIALNEEQIQITINTN